ncbi:AHH domain-containing protein [Pelotomaculum isophthalicicum JI]|uniref:AHH domain-containing protein n=1 Tax=Pelotomaculum isophthalicicum JI TaxID=947010 RepID=A0A9X4H2E7_9FIRM|nr:AHH domain-containing protein [Pelotomaculum isophthalicicum JI]
MQSGFTEKFEQIFNRAGMSLQNEKNIFFLEGHVGRHSLKYRQYVLRRLNEATMDLSGEDYKNALLKELDELKDELIKNPDIVKGVGLP